jgi:hypothetical protein
MIGRLGSRRDAGNIYPDESSRRVPDCTETEFMLDCVNEFHIPYGIRVLLYGGSDAFILYCSNSGGPLNGDASAANKPSEHTTLAKGYAKQESIEAPELKSDLGGQQSSGKSGFVAFVKRGIRIAVPSGRSDAACCGSASRNSAGGSRSNQTKLALTGKAWSVCPTLESIRKDSRVSRRSRQPSQHSHPRLLVSQPFEPHRVAVLLVGFREMSAALDHGNVLIGLTQIGDALV